MDIENLTDDELSELKRKVNDENSKRVNEALKIQKECETRFSEFFFDNRDMFLSTMEHFRNNCSDDDPFNADRCSKCRLLNIERWQIECGQIRISMDSTMALNVIEE
jgi:hypothetical protein